MNYWDKKSLGESNYVRPQCVIRDEQSFSWADVIRIEKIKKEKLEEQRNNVLRANLQFLSELKNR